MPRSSQLGHSPDASNSQALRNARLLHDTTLTTMARRVGISPAHLSLMERGHRNLQPWVVRRYVSAFGLDESAMDDCVWDYQGRPVHLYSHELVIWLDERAECPRYSDRIHFCALREGIDRSVIATHSRDEAEMYRYHVRSGGYLQVSTGPFYVKYWAHYRPLHRGEEHEVEWECEPRPNFGAVLFSPSHKWQLRIEHAATVRVPPGAESRIGLYKIVAQPPDLDILHRAYGNRVHISTNGVAFADFPDLEAGLLYGLHWEPVNGEVQSAGRDTPTERGTH